MPQRVKNNREILTISEACEKTELSPRYIQRLLHEGRLDGFKASSVWFVYEDSLSEFVAKPRKRGPKTHLGGHIENATGQETKTTQ